MDDKTILILSYRELKQALGEIPGPRGYIDFSLPTVPHQSRVRSRVPFCANPLWTGQVPPAGPELGRDGNNGGFRVHDGPVDVVLRTLREEVLVCGLYRGNTSTVLQEAPRNLYWYGTYEGIWKSLIPDSGSKDDLGPPSHLIYGELVGITYWLVFYPAYMVKRHVQTNPDCATRGFWETFQRIYEVGGVVIPIPGMGYTRD